MPCQEDLSAETLPFSVVLPLENTQNFIGFHFLHTHVHRASLSFKGAAPKVLWEEVISRRSEELKSDPRILSLGLGAMLKIWVTSSYIQFWLWPGLNKLCSWATLLKFWFQTELGRENSTGFYMQERHSRFWLFSQWSYFQLMLWMRKHKRIGIDIVS